MTQQIVAITTIVAFPLLIAYVECNAGRIDGNIIADRTFKMPFNYAAYLSSVFGSGNTIENGARRTVTTHEASSP